MEHSPFLTSEKIVCSNHLLSRAQKLKKPNVVIANAGSVLPMSAALEATKIGIMTPIFVGDVKDIEKEANDLNWDIANFEIIAAKGEYESAKVAAKVCGYGHGDILMKGDLHSDIFMKASCRESAEISVFFSPPPAFSTEGIVNVIFAILLHYR